MPTLMPRPSATATDHPVTRAGRGDATWTSAARALPARRPATPPSSERIADSARRSEEHTSELQSRLHLVCRLLLEKKKTNERPPHDSPHADRTVIAPRGVLSQAGARDCLAACHTIGAGHQP